VADATTDAATDQAGATNEPEDRMTFTEHLGELRDRLVRVAGAVMIGFFIGFAFRDELFTFMAMPMKVALAKHGIYNFRAIEITETIFVYLKLGLLAGIMGTLPYTFYQLWSFIAPGLLEKEKRSVAPLVFFSTFFFVLGAYFAYQVIIPFIAEYLAQLTVANDDIAMDVTVQSAFSFSVKLLLAFGLAFELPLIMFFLAFLGLLKWQQYVRSFRYFVVVSFITAAMLTPPDPMSQMLMAVPLNVLYWVGVASAFFIGRAREGQVRSFSIPSKVWGALTICLLLVGTAIGAGTYFLGKKKTPLHWVPDDAVWIVSVRADATLGKNAPPERTSVLRKALGLPAEAPVVDHVILAGGPEGARLTVLVGACEDETPSTGQCAGDDLLLGEGPWLERAAGGEAGLDDDPVLAELVTHAPSWVLERKPSAERLGLLPGQSDEVVELAAFTLSGDMRGEKPWVEVRITPTDAGTLTTLQNRVDIWRSDADRRQELASRAKASMASDAEVLTLLSSVLDLTDQRLDRLEPGPSDSKPLPPLRQREKELREKLRARLASLGEHTEKAPPDESLVGKLGADKIDAWRTTIENGESLVLRIELAAPQGVSAFLRLLP